MEQSYNPTGTRNRDYRPYIFAEETTFNTSLYDPFRSVDYGMYSRGVPPPANTNAMDIFLYEQKLHPPINNHLGWNPHKQKMDFPRALADQSYAYQKFAAVRNGDGSHPYRRLYATYTHH